MGAIAIAAIGDNADIYLPVQFFFSASAGDTGGP